MKLDQIIEDFPQLRKPIYAIAGVVGLALGATYAGFAAAEAGIPMWLNVTSAVYGFLAGPTFAVASKNTVVPTATVTLDYEGDPSVDGGVGFEEVSTADPAVGGPKHAA